MKPSKPKAILVERMKKKDSTQKILKWIPKEEFFFFVFHFHSIFQDDNNELQLLHFSN